MNTDTFSPNAETRTRKILSTDTFHAVRVIQVLTKNIEIHRYLMKGPRFFLKNQLLAN